MNERIKELALKAYNNVGQGTLDELSLFVQVYTEKFAELLVAECADIFKGVYTDQQRPERIDKRIKEHFEVK